MNSRADTLAPVTLITGAAQVVTCAGRHCVGLIENGVIALQDETIIALASRDDVMRARGDRGTRGLARVALPALRRVPWLLSLYLHPSHIDMSRAGELSRTVENPNRHINADIARWMNLRDPMIGGRNIAEELKNIRLPLLTMVANADGIVPRATTLWPHETIGSPQKKVVEVGTDDEPMAHAAVSYTHLTLPTIHSV